MHHQREHLTVQELYRKRVNKGFSEVKLHQLRVDSQKDGHQVMLSLHPQLFVSLD